MSERKAGRHPQTTPTPISRFVQTAMGAWSSIVLISICQVVSNVDDLHDGSLELFNFIKDGSRSRLHIMTNEPTENMINRLTFFFHSRFNFQRVGIGRTSIIKSWKMLSPAAKDTAVKVSIHLTGGTLYIQFVQAPWNGC
jgi:hypothetical protein